MKKYYLAMLLLLAMQPIFADTFYDQLCAFNFNWKKYQTDAPAGNARFFASDKEYIQAHLSSVLNILRKSPVDHLSANQYRTRMHLIDVLDGYRLAGKFPLNDARHERIPVFIDRNNTHCAVGYLMQQSGHDELAMRIAQADNYAWVKDIHVAGVAEWQQYSGFTLEELKLIQGAYDFYQPNAFTLPNRYEIPQKPAVMTAYFDEYVITGFKRAKTRAIWCRGEGEHGVLHGKWEQNFDAKTPWIIGYYEHGKRSGQWMEYYQGTKLLCRTENWRDDKLNGIRKRYDRSGTLIEEILFRDGKAVTKTNYDLGDSLVWVRKPIDSVLVWTEVYTTGGGMIAMGHESVYNPGNLQWFQNIELTALNTIAISVRDNKMPQAGNGIMLRSSFQSPALYNAPPLVQYKKEGEWIYYKDCNPTNLVQQAGNNLYQMLSNNFRHFGTDIYQTAVRPSRRLFSKLQGINSFDSIKIVYAKDDLQDFYAYGNTPFIHLQIQYYKPDEIPVLYLFSRSPAKVQAQVRAKGMYNEAGEMIGNWEYFDKENRLYKIESYVLPHKETDDKKETAGIEKTGALWKKDTDTGNKLSGSGG